MNAQHYPKHSRKFSNAQAIARTMSRFGIARRCAAIETLLARAVKNLRTAAQLLGASREYRRWARSARKVLGRA